MSEFSAALHAGTPSMTVSGPLGSARTLTLARHPEDLTTAWEVRLARILASHVVVSATERTTLIYGAWPSEMKMVTCCPTL